MPENWDKIQQKHAFSHKLVPRCLTSNFGLFIPTRRSICALRDSRISASQYTLEILTFFTNPSIEWFWVASNDADKHIWLKEGAEASHSRGFFHFCCQQLVEIAFIYCKRAFAFQCKGGAMRMDCQHLCPQRYIFSL